MGLSVDGIYWAASTFAQSAVALLAFGGFLAIWRMDRLNTAITNPAKNLLSAIMACRGVHLLYYEDPEGGHDEIHLYEFLEKTQGPEPSLNHSDPGDYPRSLVVAARYYVGLRSFAEAQNRAHAKEGTIQVKSAAFRHDPFGFDTLQARLAEVVPIVDTLSTIEAWLRRTSGIGIVSFAFAMLLVGNAELVVAIPKPLGFLVVYLFAVAVIATTVCATMLARWCFAPIVDEPTR